MSQCMTNGLFYPQRKQGAKFDEEDVQLPPEVFGRPRAAAGSWGSCIRIIDPVEVQKCFCRYFFALL